MSKEEAEKEFTQLVVESGFTFFDKSEKDKVVSSLVEKRYSVKYLVNTFYAPNDREKGSKLVHEALMEAFDGVEFAKKKEDNEKFVATVTKALVSCISLKNQESDTQHGPPDEQSTPPSSRTRSTFSSPTYKPEDNIQLEWSDNLGTLSILHDAELITDTTTSYMSLKEEDFRTGSKNRIIIRECYQRVLDKISQRIKLPFSEPGQEFPRTRGAPSFVLIGTPGVGKTLFSLYLIYLMIKSDVAFVYEAYGRMQLYRASKCVYGEEKVVAIVENMSRKEQLIYVVDGQAPNQIISNYMNVSTILVCSPRLVYVDQLTKDHTNRDVTFIFMPTWDLDELEQCRAMCYPNFSQEEIQRRYQECGGVARTIFAGNYPELWGKTVSAIQECDPTKLFNIQVSKYAVYTSNEASHRIVHIFVDPLDYLPYKVTFASDKIQSLVHLKYKENVNKSLRDFFNVLNPLKASDHELGILRGSYFEQFCYYLLVSNKKFLCRHLSGRQLSNFRDTDIFHRTEDSRSWLYYDNSGQLMRKTPYDSINSFKNNEEDNNVLYVCKKNFPTIDAFHVNHQQKVIYMFQVTTNGDHFLSLGKYEVIDLIQKATMSGTRPYRVLFLWLVPWFAFESYTPQPLKVLSFPKSKENTPLTPVQVQALATFNQKMEFWENCVHHYCLSVGNVTDPEFANYIDQI